MKELYIYEVNPSYLRFLHKVDHRVSVKFNNRPFVGVITMINGMEYLLPLTSKTTIERKKEGKKKRADKITTFIRDTSGKEIANILHNNMIPVSNQVCKIKMINSELDTFESNEIRFIRKHKNDIISKARKVYEDRIKQKDPFLNRMCCDFKLLEKYRQKYLAKNHKNLE